MRHKKIQMFRSGAQYSVLFSLYLLIIAITMSGESDAIGLGELLKLDQETESKQTSPPQNRHTLTRHGGVSDFKMRKIAATANLLRSPGEKVGLAILTDDSPSPRPTASIVHRYQLLDIQAVIDNILDFTKDVKHPPTVDGLTGKAQFHEQHSHEEKSIIGNVRNKVKQSMASVEDYSLVIARFHRFYEKYKYYEAHSNHFVRGILDLILEEFNKAKAEAIEEESAPMVSGILVSEQESYRKLTSNGNKDSILEVLRKTINRLERKLQRESLTASLTGAGPKIEFDDLKIESSIQKYKRDLMAEIKARLISEAKSMTKVAVVGLLTGYLANKDGSKAEGYMKYVGHIMEFLLTATSSLAVKMLRDEETRTSLTLLDVLDPMPHLKTLIRTKIIG